MNIIEINKNEVGRFLYNLAKIGQVGKSGVTRLAYTPEWVEALDYCRAYAVKSGLDVYQDAVGNVWARLKGKSDTAPLVTGSHIDTQINGGRYDGSLGVIAGLISLKALKEQFGQPENSLEAVIFCEEEGSRFPKSGFWGSRAVVGKITNKDLMSTISFEGEPIQDCMTGVGLKPDQINSAERHALNAFIELHIEQGPVLETNRFSVGLVTSITGMAQFEVTLEGIDNHAGTCPMDLRVDPMAGFAEITTSLINQTLSLGRPYVTTIGQISAEPGGVAVIPSSVRFSIDARHPDPKLRTELYSMQDKLMREICDRRGLGYCRDCLMDIEPCESDQKLIKAIGAAADDLGIPLKSLVSGAGHDAQQISKISPVAMIFVRSVGGISHSPDEFSTLDDCTDGIRMLAQTLYRLAYTS